MKQRDREKELVDSDAALDLLLLAGPRKKVPPARKERALATVSQHWRRRVAGRRRRRMVLAAASLAAAASFLVVAVQVWFGAPGAQDVARVEVLRGSLCSVVGGHRSELGVGSVVPDGATLETGEHSRAALRLVDGASLRLDTGTRISFAGMDQARLDCGAVYLDSGADSELGTVAVSTALGEVIDVGTQYEVRLVGDDLRVRVREGLVILRRDPAVDEIRAGQELLLGVDGRLSRLEITPSDPGWAWLLEVAPPFHLPGCSAATFLRWVERETGYQLRWTEPQLATEAEKIILQGDITAVRPDQAPGVVLPTCGLSHRLEEGVMVVGIMRQ